MIKATIDGEEYVFDTVRELIDFRREMKREPIKGIVETINEAVKKEREKKPEREEGRTPFVADSVPHRKSAHWKKAEVKKLKELVASGAGWGAISKELGRTLNGARTKYYQVTSAPEKTKPKKTISMPAANRDFASKRMKFIHSRIKTIIAAQNWIPYEQAFAQASQEYAAHGRGQKATAPSADIATVIAEWPSMESVSPVSKDALINALKDLVANGREMTFFAVQNFLTPPDGTDEFRGWHWHSLLAEVVRKGDGIAAYFGVKNKFKIIMRGEYEYLAYG